MAYSYLQVIGDGTTNTYNIAFSGPSPGYISRDHIFVSYDEEIQDQSLREFVTDTQIRLLNVPDSGTIIKIYRESNIESAIVDFEGGAALTEKNLDLNTTQMLMLAQESADSAGVITNEALEYAQAAFNSAQEAADSAEEADTDAATASEAANTAEVFSALSTEAAIASAGYRDEAEAFVDSIGDLGGGDMLKSTYDSNNDGTVDSADTAAALTGTQADAIVVNSAHVTDTDNPHEVDKTDVGLGNVTDDAQLTTTQLETSITDDDTKVPSSGAVVDYSADFMGKTTYDTDDDGKVNSADSADNALALSNATLETSVTDDDTKIPSSGALVDYVSANAVTGVDVQTAVTDDDTKIPTSGAIVDYVTTLGAGDMLKSTYDTDDSGQVDSADDADALSGATLALSVTNDDTKVPSSGAVVDYVSALGGGDMTAATYDPTGVSDDVFDMDNMVEGTAKILTAAERTALSNLDTNDNKVYASAYGAVGDGATDDSTSIQNAIDAAQAIGATVVLEPNKTYKLSTGLNMQQGYSGSGLRYTALLDGQDAVLKPDAGVLALFIEPRGLLASVGAGNSVGQVRIQNLYINGSANSSTCKGLKIGKTGYRIESHMYSMFNNITLVGFDNNSAIELIESRHMIFNNINVRGGTFYIYAETEGSFCGDLLFQACEFVGSTSNPGLKILSGTGSTSTRVAGIRFDSTTFYHAEYTLVANGDSVNGKAKIQDIWFNHCQFDASSSSEGTDVLSVTATNGAMLSQLHITDSWFVPAFGRAIVIDKDTASGTIAENIQIQGCGFGWCGTDSTLSSTTSPVTTTVIGCYDVDQVSITDNTFSRTAAINHIVLANTDNATVTGNSSVRSINPGQDQRGVYVYGSSDILNVLNNTFSCNGTGPVAFADVSTGTVKQAAFNMLDDGTGATELGSASGITSVSAGNGMDFSDITTTGSVTLGTPSSITTSTGNTVSGTSHTHALSGITSNVSTNLGTTYFNSAIIVTSSDGDDATINGATLSNAGVMTTAMKSKLDGIDNGAEVNVDTNLGVVQNNASTLTVTSSTGNNVTLPAATTSYAGMLTASGVTSISSSAGKLVSVTGVSDSFYPIVGDDVKLGFSGHAWELVRAVKFVSDTQEYLDTVDDLAVLAEIKPFEIEKSDKKTGERKKVRAKNKDGFEVIDFDSIPSYLHGPEGGFDNTRFLAITNGAVRQLDIEVKEMFEFMCNRITTLEKKVKELGG